MADILSQEEIDALLSTVSDDGIKEEQLEEIDFTPKKVSVYDFRRPDRVSKEQLRSIRNLHDKFARNFSSTLSNSLRLITDITLVSVDQMTYGEFLMSLPDPTSFNIISMIPLEGNAVLEINPSLIFPIVDKLLGGPGQPLYKVRELTTLEHHIIEGIMGLMLEDLEDVWRQILPNIRFKKEISENSPQIVQIVAQNEVVVLIVFEVKFGEVSGMINLCLPAITIEPILGKISFEGVTFWSFLSIVVTFLFVDFFDTVGTLVGVATKAKMLDEKGHLPGAKKALMADAIGTTAGALLGTSTVTTYVESAAGVTAGGRTGLTAVVCGILFFFSMFFAPVIMAIPACATAPALILVGFMMIQGISEIDFEEKCTAIPVFITMIFMPLTYSIANGLIFGIISYVFLNMFTKEGKEVSIVMKILAVLFIIRLMFPGGH
jgi:flagellar motor switch protein FliM